MKKRVISLLLIILVLFICIFTACSKEEVQPIKEQEENGCIRIACISDLHSRDGNLINQKLRGVVETTLNAYIDEDIDYMIMGGDLASGTIISEDKNNILLDKFNNLATQSTDKIFYLVGNHDYSTAHNLYPSSSMSTLLTNKLYYKYNSADYYNKYMKNNTALGSPISIYEEYYDNRDNQTSAQCNYVLGYHYKLDNIHFIGLNTYPGDLIAEKQRFNYTLTAGTIAYAIEELKSINKNEIVFLMCHYPLNDSNNLRKDKGLLEEVSNNFKEQLLNYENVIYLYGHDHKNGVDRNGNPTNCYIKEHTTERITEYTKEDGSRSFVSCFMRSMSYENTPGEPNTAIEDPTIAQSLIIEVYKDKIILQMKNYGIYNGGSQAITPYIITR